MKIYIAKDATIDLHVSKVVKFLNTKCDYITFEELPLSLQVKDTLIKYPNTHKKYLKHINTELESDEFIILATETQYDNNYFYEEEKRLIILSFFAWKYLTSLSIENGLVYLICGMLIEEIVPRHAVDHTERLGCVNDFLADKTRVDDGMRQGHLCNNCKEYIQKHKLSNNQSLLFHDISSMLRELATASQEERNIIHDKKNIHSSSTNFFLAEKNTVKNNDSTSIFISYSHRDEKDRMKLEDHLKILQRTGIISTWTDRKITAGDEWKNQIDKNLKICRVILLLVSSNFIASDYCYENEMKTALERHANNEATVIPIILRDCFWQAAPFAKLQALPQDGKPIQKFARKDEAYTSIARAICRIIQEK